MSSAGRKNNLSASAPSVPDVEQLPFDHLNTGFAFDEKLTAKWEFHPDNDTTCCFKAF